MGLLITLARHLLCLRQTFRRAVVFRGLRGNFVDSGASARLFHHLSRFSFLTGIRAKFAGHTAVMPISNSSTVLTFEGPDPPPVRSNKTRQGFS